MNKTIAHFFTGIGVFLLGGCANTLTVTYNSDPPGAVLYQGQQRFGYTPYTLQYPVSKADKELGYKTLAGTSVRWISGAAAEISSLKADLNQYGLAQQFTFQRPDDVPGRETDFRFSLELDQTRSLQRQARAQEVQAAAQRRQAAAQEERVRNDQYKKSFPTNCTSTLNGNIINTSCY